MADTDPRNTEQSYVYHTPTSSYNYPNKPFEPFPQKEPKHIKKKHAFRIPICIVSILLILALGLFLSYQTIPSVKRFVYKNFLGTEKYYLYMESTNLKKNLASIRGISKGTNITYPGTNRSSTPLQGSVDLMLNSALNESNDDIHNFRFDYTYEPTKENSRTSMVFSYDTIDLLSLDLLENDQKQYLLFPQLSDTFVDITDLLQLLASNSDNIDFNESPDSSSLTSSYLNNQELIINLLNTINDDMFSKFLKRYGTRFIEDVAKYSQITLKENVPLDLTQYTKDSKENISSTLDCEQFNVSITTNDAINIVQNLLSLVRTDEDIIQVVEAAGVDSFYFHSALTYISVQLEALKKSNSRPIITMELYTYGNAIVYRNMQFGHQNPYEFVLCSYEKEDSHLFFTSLGEKNKDSLDFSVSLNYSTKKEGATGQGVARLGENSFLLYFENLKDDQSVYSILPTGSFSIQAVEDSSENSIKDGSIVYKGIYKGNKMEASITVGNKETTFLRLSMSFKAYESKAFDFPEKDSAIVSVTDKKQLKEYLESSSLDKVLDSVSSSFNITIHEQDVIESILDFLDSLQE